MVGTNSHSFPSVGLEDSLRQDFDQQNASNTSRGVALISALLLLAVFTLLGAFWYLTVRLKVGMAENDASRRSALTMAYSGYSLMTVTLSALFEADPLLAWDRVFTGADGVSPCPSSFSEETWNPVDPFSAWQAPWGILSNRCGDDGTLVGFSAIPNGLDPAGLMVFQTNSGEILYCLSNPCGPGKLVGQVWFKISNNPEPAGNMLQDQDGKAVLRVLASTRGSFLDAPDSLSARNSLAAIEAWLALSEDRELQVLSLRELTF